MTDIYDVPEHAGIEGYEPSFLDVDGTNTRYYDVGDGEPIVLVHGGNWKGSSSANPWIPTAAHLASEFRVLAFDRIGCGLTDNPDRPEEYRYGTELEHALGFLDAMDLGTCHLWGYSRGGGLAARMAVETPDRFESLGIVNSATLGPPAGDKRFRTDRIFDRSDAGTDPSTPSSIRNYYEQYCYRTEEITEELCRTAAYLRSRPKAERTADAMAERGQQWLETMREHMRETRRRLSEGVFEGPVLYVLGRNDLTVPVEMALAGFDTIAQGTPDVRMHVINHCGHMAFLEYPEEFAGIVADFLDRMA